MFAVRNAAPPLNLTAKQKVHDAWVYGCVGECGVGDLGYEYYDDDATHMYVCVCWVGSMGVWEHGCPPLYVVGHADPNTNPYPDPNFNPDPDPILS